jgi:putative transposase
MTRAAHRQAALADARKPRCPNIFDECTPESVAIDVDTSFTGRRVVTVLARLADTRGQPRSITVDHGPEFAGHSLDARAYAKNLQLAFIRPAKPVDNAYIESCNGRFGR